MEFCIDTNNLRKALSEIERAENNGFDYCLAIFRFAKAGRMLDDNIAEYSDLIEKAHPTDGHLDWGRGQDITKNYKFINGKPVRIRGK